MNKDDFELLPSIQDMAIQLHRNLLQKVEERLVARIEELEGRVPSNEEVARHGHRVIYPDGKQEYTWKGMKILEVLPMTDPLKYGWTVNG